MRLARPARLSIATAITGLLSVGWPVIFLLPCFLLSRTVPTAVALAAGQTTPTRRITAFKDPAAHTNPVRRPAIAPHVALVDEYCLSCHDKDHEKGKLVLDTVAEDDVAEHPEIWEKVIRKLRARLMPPVGKERPDDP